MFVCVSALARLRLLLSAAIELLSFLSFMARAEGKKRKRKTLQLGAIG